MGLGPLGPLAHRARVLLVLRRGRNGSAYDDPTRHQGLLQPPAAHGGGGPLPDDQPSCVQMLHHHCIDARYRHPIAQAQPHAEAGVRLTQLGKQHRTRKAAVRDQAPAEPGRKSALEPLEKPQGRRPELPFGPGVREDGPANGQRTARHDDARHPDFPASEPGRIQRYHHGLVCSQQCKSLVDQRWADYGLVKGWPAPPAPHPPQARPAGASVLGRQGTGQRRRSSALCDE
jgi:hypothetical protein